MRTHAAPAPAVLQRTCTCGKSAPVGGECEECKRGRGQGETVLQRSPGAHFAPPPPPSGNGPPGRERDFSAVRVSRRARAPRPRRLTIGPVDDAFEREADRIAGAVTASHAAAVVYPVAPIQRAPLRLQRQVDEDIDPDEMLDEDEEDEDFDVDIDEDVDEEDVDELQAKPAGPLPDQAPRSVERYVGHLDQSGGAPLPTGSREALEPRLGRDLGAVRIHTDAAAAGAARGVNARAFTVGRHIVFGAGQYSPNSAAGQHLLTHELAHVVQQSRGVTRTIQRVPWGTCPPGTRLSGSRPDRYGAAEAAAYFYFLNQRRGNCIARNDDDLAGLKCAQPEGRLLAEQFHSGKSKVRKRPVMPAEDVAAPGADPSTLTGYVSDFAYRQLVPDLIDFTKHEFYDVTTKNMASAKKEKVAWYARLAAAITGKPWKAGKTLAAPGIPTFSLYPGKQPTKICFGSTDLAKRPGVISYEVIGTKEQKKKDKKEDEERKKKREEKKRKKEEAKKRKEAEKRKKKAEKKAKKEAKKKAKKSKKPAEPKKPKKPKEPKKPKKPKEPKKPKAPGASAANIGFGISIGGGGGAGNVGVGVSIMSNGYSFGTVSAGVAYDSDGVSVGSVGAGASSGSTSVGAGTAGATLSKDTASATAGAAGATKTEGSMSAGAGIAVTGSSKDDITAGAGVAGKVESEGRVGAAAGTSGTVKKDTPPGAGGKPGGTQQEGTKEPGKGEGVGKAGTPGAAPGGTQAEGGKQPVQGATGTGKGTTPSEKGDPGKHGLSIPGLTPAQTDKAVEDAAAIEAMIRNARPTQRQLLAFLAQREGDQRYVVPAKTWVTTILSATNHVKDEDLLYLLELNWTPGQVTADQLKKDIDAAIKRKGAPQGVPADPQAKPDTKQTKQGKQPAKVDTPHPDAKKPTKQLGPPGPPSAGDKEPKESEADYIKRLQKRAAEWKGWPGMRVGHVQIQYADNGKPQSMILFAKGEENGKEILATCDLYGRPFTKGKKKMVHVTQSGPTVTADGRFGPPGKWNRDYTDMGPQ